MRILVAEDDSTNAFLLRKTLEGDDHEVTVAADGLEALRALGESRFDALVTDWMMPELDGMGLIARVRAEFDEPPAILVVTALTSDEARRHALEVGADDYLSKPFDPQRMLTRVRQCIRRNQSPPPAPPDLLEESIDPVLGETVGVGLAASTGGPESYRALVSGLDPSLSVAWFAVQHGPEWMVETLVDALRDRSRLAVRLARDGETIRPHRLYVCPGDHHMRVDEAGSTLRVDQGPPVNHARPSADPLFQSLARAYGERAMGVVLSGMGRDAVAGARAIRQAGGRILVQDPDEAVAAGMPRTIARLGLADEILPLRRIAPRLSSAASRRLPDPVSS